MSGTNSNVLIGGLSAVEVVLGEELGQLRLDATQGLVLAMKQHYQVWHGECLAHQHQQLSKKPWEPQKDQIWKGATFRTIIFWYSPWQNYIIISCPQLLYWHIMLVYICSLPVGSSGLMKMLVAWDSLCMNWAMLSVSFWAWPREPIMVLRTPRTMPVNSSGLRASAAPGGLGVGLGPAAGVVPAGVVPAGGGGGEKMGWEA